MLGNHPRFGALTEPAAQPRPVVVPGLRSFSLNVQPPDLTFQCTGRLRRLPRASWGASPSAFGHVNVPTCKLSSPNLFRIRTSETPLPQLLYNPHLRAPLGSAGNKRLITPLESALTENSPVTRLESALAERRGGGAFLPFRNSPHATRHYALCSSLFFSDYSTLFCVFLRLPKTQPFCFHAIPNSLRKTPGGWVAPLHCSLETARPRTAVVEGHTSNRDHRHTARESLGSAILSTP